MTKIFNITLINDFINEIRNLHDEKIVLCSNVKLNYDVKRLYSLELDNIYHYIGKDNIIVDYRDSLELKHTSDIIINILKSENFYCFKIIKARYNKLNKFNEYIVENSFFDKELNLEKQLQNDKNLEIVTNYIKYDLNNSGNLSNLKIN